MGAKEQIIEGKNEAYYSLVLSIHVQLPFLTYHLTFFVATPKQYRQPDSTINVKSVSKNLDLLVLLLSFHLIYINLHQTITYLIWRKI